MALRTALLSLVLLAALAPADARIRLGGVSIGAGYSHFSGRYPYWGYYSPWYYDPCPQSFTVMLNWSAALKP
jgi:hypothetical protein